MVGKLVDVDFDVRRRRGPGRETLTDPYGYDAAGRLVTSQTEAGVTEVAYGQPFSLPKSVVRGASSTIYEQEAFFYDSLGRLDHISDGAKTLVSFGYDGLERVARETRPSASTPGANADTLRTYLGGTALPSTLTMPSGRKLVVRAGT